MPAIHAFDYLQQPAQPTDEAAICVLFGGVPLLKQLARNQLLAGAPDADRTDFEPPLNWRDLKDELSTNSLFGSGRRLVLVHDADSLVSQQRSELEQYVAAPRAGTLVLEMASFPANTKLYKAVAKHGLAVDCRVPETARGRGKPTPDVARIATWLRQRAAAAYQCQLDNAGAQTLLEMVGLEFGMLDQELAKLALFAEPGQKMTGKDVRRHCGGWTTQTTWELVDSAVDGNAALALEQLDQLLRSGQDPLALFPQMAWALRRFSLAAHLYVVAQRQKQRLSLRDALLQAGFQSFRVGQAEKQLKRLGQRRAVQLLRQLLDADLALKGTHSSKSRQRFVLEQLVIHLSAPA